MRVTIKTRLFGGFALILILMVISAVMAMGKLSDVNEMLTSIVRGSAHEVKLAEGINSDMLEITGAEKDLILSETQQEKEKYASSIDKLQKELESRREELKGLSDDEGKAMLNGFAATWNEYLGVHKQARDLAFLNSNVKAEQLSEGAAREAFERAASVLAVITEENEREAARAVDVTELKNISARTRLAERINRNLVELQRAEKNLILSETAAEMETQTRSLEKQTKDLEDRMNGLETIATGDAKNEIKKLREQYELYLLQHTKVVELARQNGNNRAFELVSGKGRELAEKSLSLMANIIAKNENDMEKDKAAGDRDYASARNMLIILAGISLCLGIGLALWIALNISRGISNAINVTKFVAEGDLSKDVVVSSRDEIGDLLTYMKNMVSNLRDTAHVADRVAEGDLSVQVKLLSEKDTVGKALLNMVSNLRDTSQAADRIADGDLNVRVKVLSEKDSLGQALLNMVEKLREVVSEVKAAADNVAAGSQQMSSSSEEMSQGATEQAAAAEEASSSMEEMASNIRQNADNALRRKRSPSRRPRTRGEGGSAVSETVSAMKADRAEDIDHRGDRPADQSAGAERGHRGGPGRRARQGIRGGGVGSEEAGRTEPDGGGRDRQAFDEQRGSGGKSGRDAQPRSCRTFRRRRNWCRRSARPARSRTSAPSRSTRRSSSWTR